MIICPTQGFVFVHVPKCAGTTMRTQVKLCDPAHIALGEVHTHPTLGRIDYGHVPLTAMRTHFPEEYAAIRDLTSFAVLREPLPRFGSALRQTLWRYEKRPMTAIPPGEVRDLARRMLDELGQALSRPPSEVLPPRFAFFARQADFLDDEGKRLVDHVLPTELVPDLISYLGRRCGVALDVGARHNQNVDLRLNKLGGPAFAVNSVLRRTLPTALHGRIKGAALRLLATGKSAAETSGLLDLPEIRDFVAEHYARDAALHAEAQATIPALRRALAEGTLSPEIGGKAAA
jgi:hypothetical protein